MNLIESKAVLLQQGVGLSGLYKHIEICGRTCYKSEDKITKVSSEKFIENLIKREHTAMLEHGTVYLKVPNKEVDVNWIDKYTLNPYSKINLHTDNGVNNWYITTNLRVIHENNWYEDLKYRVNPTRYHERRYTFKLTTDRGVSHELVRSRTMSFAQESTRFCNYTKDKFNSELTFICPSWIKLNTGKYEFIVEKDNSISIAGDGYLKSTLGTDKDIWLLHSMLTSEMAYKGMILEGCTPQEARQVLPNSLKTEICITGFASDWVHFFNLRLFGTTGKPHPDMLRLAELMKAELEKAKIWKTLFKKEPKRYEN